MPDDIGLGEEDELITDPELGEGIEDEDDEEDDGLSDLERDQSKHGWRPKGEWKGDPDDWVNARRFKEKGDMLSEMGRLKTDIGDIKKDFGDRLKNATMFVNAQNNALRQQLESKRDNLIAQGDVAEVKKVDKQLKDIPDDGDEASVKKTGNMALLDWKQANDWVFDESSAKFKFADNHFKIAAAKGMSMQESLAYVDEKVADKYPDKEPSVNPRRNEASLGESGGRSSGGKGKGGLIPKSQWTHEESEIAAGLSDNFTPKEIQQMVTDSRSAGS